jgi:hypothetical protein
MRGR